MKIRVEFCEPPPALRPPLVVEMDCVPRVGEFLVSGAYGTYPVLKVTYPPDADEQDVILTVGPSQS